MSVRLVSDPALTIELSRRGLGAEEMLADPELLAAIRLALRTFTAAVDRAG